MAVAFFLDVDNTLIDNDAARARLWDDTDRVLGPDLSKAFWGVYEEVRTECGFVDFLETLSRFHARERAAPSQLDRAILDFPYGAFRYGDALGVIASLWTRGTVAILSDGDPVFQPLKISRAGLADAVRGNVLVFSHKDARLDDVARLFPAERYVVVDDKAEVLGRIKMHWGERVTTVHVLQGKYSDDPHDGPAPDVVLPRIGALLGSTGTPELRRVFQDAMTPLASGTED